MIRSCGSLCRIGRRWQTPDVLFEHQQPVRRRGPPQPEYGNGRLRRIDHVASRNLSLVDPEAFIENPASNLLARGECDRRTSGGAKKAFGGKKHPAEIESFL